MLLPHNVLHQFVHTTLPQLWRLTVRSIRASALYLSVTPILISVVLSHHKARVDDLTMIEKIEKAMLALGWYVIKCVHPVNLCAAVELRSVSVWDHWEVAACLILVPYGTMLILVHSLQSTPGRVGATAWGVMVALLLPALGFVQHAGNMVYAADRYLYIPLAMLGPLLGAVAGGLYTIVTTSCAEASVVVVDDDDCASVIIAGGPIPDAVTSVDAAWCPIDFLDASMVTELMERKSKQKSGGKQARNNNNNNNRGESSSSKSVQSASGAGISSRGPERCLVATESSTHGRRALVASATAATLTLVGLLAAVLVLFVTSMTPTALTYWRNTRLLWERNIEIYPDSINAHVPLANHYSEVQDPPDYDRALYHARYAVNLDPAVYENRFNLGQIYLHLKEYDDAAHIFRSLLREDPRHDLVPKVVVDLAIALHQMGEWDAAVRELEQAVKMKEPRAGGALRAIARQREEDPEGERRQRERWQAMKKRKLLEKKKRRSADQN